VPERESKKKRYREDLIQKKPRGESREEKKKKVKMEE